MLSDLVQSLPVLVNAVKCEESLPRSLRSDLYRACFALVAILKLDLTKDPANAVRVIKEFDFGKAVIPTVVDDQSLTTALKSITQLKANQGVFLPAEGILNELLACTIISKVQDRWQVLGEKYGVVEYYGSQFPLISGQVLIDTKVGRIKRVLEIAPAQNKAIVEVLDLDASTADQTHLYSLVNGKPMLKVGLITPNRFNVLAYNDFGQTLGVYQVGRELYLFQSNQIFPVDLDGDFINAEFLKETKKPTGIIATSKFVYLIKEGELHEKLSVDDYPIFDIHSALVEIKGKSQIVFWGELTKDDRSLPFLNYDLSSFQLEDSDFLSNDPSFDGILAMELETSPVFYQGKLFFQATIEDRGRALCIVSLCAEGYPIINAIFLINQQQVEAFQACPEFHATGNAIVQTAGQKHCIFNGEFLQESENSIFITSMPCHVLPSSKAIIPELLCSSTGWKLILDPLQMFNLRSVKFPNNPNWPIGIHVNENNELTCLAESARDGTLTFYCANHLVSLEQREIFGALIGVHYYNKEEICCLFVGEEGYTGLFFRDQEDELITEKAIPFTIAEITPIGLVGNLDSETPTLVINNSLITDYSYKSFLRLLREDLPALDFIQTDRGIILVAANHEASEIINDYELESLPDGKVRVFNSKKNHPQVSFQFLGKAVINN